MFLLEPKGRKGRSRMGLFYCFNTLRRIFSLVRMNKEFLVSKSNTIFLNIFHNIVLFFSPKENVLNLRLMYRRRMGRASLWQLLSCASLNL
jgi:hypothetical protein